MYVQIIGKTAQSVNVAATNVSSKMCISLPFTHKSVSCLHTHEHNAQVCVRPFCVWHTTKLLNEPAFCLQVTIDVRNFYHKCKKKQLCICRYPFSHPSIHRVSQSSSIQTNRSFNLPSIHLPIDSNGTVVS